MASGMRSTRRQVREDLLRTINSGHGNRKLLVQMAGDLLGRQVGYATALQAFAELEASNALAQLRKEGLVETVGKLWKRRDELEPEDVDIISVRRRRRLKGELKSEIEMLREHSRDDDAESAELMLSIVEQLLEKSNRNDDDGEAVLA